LNTDLRDSIKQHYDKESSIQSWSCKGSVKDVIDTYGELSQNRAIFGDKGVCGTVMDLATGTGHYARKALECGAGKVVCVDLSSKMLAKARELSQGLNGLDFVQADGAKLPFREGVFDGVVNVGLFEHLSETSDILQCLHRVLKDDGVLVTRFLNGWSVVGIFTKIRAKLTGKVPFGYPLYRMYSVRQAKQIHRGMFEVEDVRHCLLMPLPIMPGVVLRFLRRHSNGWFVRAIFGAANRIEKVMFRSRLAGLFSYCFVIVFRKDRRSAGK
jgi:ubiquinone/menaquinone biosynthesis C-methylase UbiE